MNTLKNLERKISFFFSGYGHNKVTIKFRGKEYKCTSTNTQAIDRIKDDNEGMKDSYYKTKKQAYLSLYNEVKRANNLK
jgi:translation initiation factor IF-3